MPLYNDNYTLNSTFNQTDDYTVSLMMNGSEVAPKLPRNFRICNQPNTALWSTILCVFTFFIALFMRKLRHSKLFGKQVRCAVVRVTLETMGYSPFSEHAILYSIDDASVSMLPVVEPIFSRPLHVYCMYNRNCIYSAISIFI